MSGGTEFLRAGEIARLTGMSIRTVRRWIADEIIPSVKLGGARLVAKAELAGLLTPPITTTQPTNAGDKEA
jgi:excisionase family DNA binding protein